MRRRFDFSIVAISLLILVGGLLAISWQTVRSAETLLLPALDRQAESVAQSIGALASDAVGYGIALEDLVRVDEVLRAALDENRDFVLAAIVDANNEVVAEVTRRDAPGYAQIDTDEILIATAPIIGDDGPVGRVAIATPITVSERLVTDLWIDVAVLLLVAVLVAFELTAFAFSLPSAQLLRGLTQRLDSLRSGDLRPHMPLGGTGPIMEEIEEADSEVARVRCEHQRLLERANTSGNPRAKERLAALSRHYRLNEEREVPPVSLAAIRAPVFLFFFAEELTRPFLPTYIARYAEPVGGLSVELVIALPIVLFMAIVALSQPILNDVTERFGRVRSLRFGALIAAFGFMGTGFASSMAEIVAFRALTGVGFAVVFVSAQGYIVDRTEPRQRARGIGVFVSAIMAAMLCGPPIGGILADRLGDTAAFTVSAVMALIATVCALVALPGDQARSRFGTGRAVRFRDVGIVLRQPVMLALLVGTAMPSKILLIGVCFYFLPLWLASQFEPATIGRVLMLYGLAMLLVIPAISRWSDEAALRVPFVLLGAFLSALAPAHLFFWAEPWGAALMVLQIGIAQGISTTPQSALVGEIGRRIIPDLSEGGIYGVFRLVERLGTAVGPLFVGAVWTIASPQAALAATGALVAFGALAFALAWWGASGAIRASGQVGQ